MARRKETGEMFSHLVEDERTCLLFLQSLHDPRVAEGWSWEGIGCMASSQPPYPEGTLEAR